MVTKHHIVSAGSIGVAAALRKRLAIITPQSGIVNIARRCSRWSSWHKNVAMRCTRRSRRPVIIATLPSKTERRRATWRSIHACARPVSQHISRILILSICEVVRTGARYPLAERCIAIHVLQVWAGFGILFVLLLILTLGPRCRLLVSAGVRSGWP